MRHHNSVFHGVLKHVPWTVFDRLVEEFKTKNEILSFFLGILELIRLRTVKVYQANPMGLITIVPAVREGEDGRESEEPDTR